MGRSVNAGLALQSPAMGRETIEKMLEALRRLPPRERVEIADAVDRLVWRDRVQIVLDGMAGSAGGAGAAPSDDEIDAIVKDVRSESSLYERYWTLRRSSAA